MSTYPTEVKGELGKRLVLHLINIATSIKQNNLMTFLAECISRSISSKISTIDKYRTLIAHLLSPFTVLKYLCE